MVVRLSILNIPEKKCWVIPFKHHIIKIFYRLFRDEEIKLDQFMSSFSFLDTLS